MKPPSSQTTTTFFSGWKRQVVVANGSPTPMVVKELSRSNVLGSYACIHKLPTYHPISAFQFFPFLVHPAILIRNLWLRRLQENNWKMFDAKLFNASVWWSSSSTSHDDSWWENLCIWKKIAIEIKDRHGNGELWAESGSTMLTHTYSVPLLITIYNILVSCCFKQIRHEILEFFYEIVKSCLCALVQPQEYVGTLVWLRCFWTGRTSCRNSSI